MMKQIMELREKEVLLVHSSSPRADSDDELDEGTGGLVAITKTTKTSLEAAFSKMMSNSCHRKQILQKYGFHTVTKSAALIWIGYIV